jgi:4-carboxymuconolactone decarboxylase
MSRFEAGLAVRKAVLGSAHVERAQANQSEFDKDFQTYITENVWGAVWTREGLERPVRHLVTIGLLAGLGKEHELELHLRSIKNTGVTQAQVREVLLQVAVYAGVPAANSAVALAKKIFAEQQHENP